jgi:hypothetical protein
LPGGADHRCSQWHHHPRNTPDQEQEYTTRAYCSTRISGGINGLEIREQVPTITAKKITPSGVIFK